MSEVVRHMHGSEKRDVEGVKNVKLLIDQVRGGKRDARQERRKKASTKGSDRRDTE